MRLARQDAAVVRKRIGGVAGAWGRLAAGDLPGATATALALLDLARGPSPAVAGDDEHAARLILGHVELQLGDIDAAVHHLLAAAEIAPSPGLRSAGPNTSLAYALLRRGQTVPVRRYLERCSTFWRSRHGQARTATWLAAIDAGRSPDLGPNLTIGWPESD